MAYDIYRNHTIVCSAVYDDVNGKWKSSAYVSWQESGSDKRTQSFRHSPELFSCFDDAPAFGDGFHTVRSAARDRIEISTFALWNQSLDLS